MSLMTSWLSREQEDYHMGDDDIPNVPKPRPSRSHRR